MTTTINQLVEEVNKINLGRDGREISAEMLCQQLSAAGVEGKSVEDSITVEEKNALLNSLRCLHKKPGSQCDDEFGRVVLKRKTISEIKVPVVGSTSGRAKVRFKTVNVELRKPRTYVRRAQLNEDLKRRQEEEERAAALQQQAADRSVPVVDEPTALPPDTEAVDAPLPVVPEPDQDGPDQASIPEAESPPGTPSSEQESEPEQPAAAASASESTSTASQVSTAVPAAPVVKAAPLPDKNLKDRSPRSKAAGKREKLLHVAGEKAGRRVRRKRPRMGRASPLPVMKPMQGGGGFEKPTAPVVRDVELPQRITVADLAGRMSVKASEVIKAMMEFGSMVAINDYIDQDTASVLVEQMGHRAVPLKEIEIEDVAMQEAQEQGERLPRPPVITIMGHVDHGKTSLLDYIRKTRIAADESGGITQHIGAYQISSPECGTITFLDTPGHEAFAAMRGRGAKVTDLVIVVVAADDGVMPQTIEAIKHAQAAAVPILVAINKIDKDDANIDQVQQEMGQHGVLPESWGGETQFIGVSAKTGEGVDVLLEAVLLQTEILELRAVVQGPARGTVLESRLDTGRGPVISVLIRSGTLKKGDVILSGQAFGRVRRMVNDCGTTVSEAGPAMPVEVLGLSGLPQAGDELIVLEDERRARQIASVRQDQGWEQRIARTQSVEDARNLFADNAERTDLNLLLKADVQGSAEALAAALSGLGNEQIRVNLIHCGVGRITESDINLIAAVSSGMVLGFNVRADAAARKRADAAKIEVRYYSVIYDVLDDVKAIVSGLMAPEIREQIIGLAEVREVFRSPKFGDIAGCIVTSGSVRLRSPIRVLRDDVVIYEGELESLRRFKDEVKEVRSGVECGIGVKHYKNVRIGDRIEAFERVQVQPSTAS